MFGINFSEEDWYGSRQAAFEEIAKAWLEAHHIPYA